MVARKGLITDLRKVSTLYFIFFDDCLKKIKIWAKCLTEITWALVKIAVLIERKKKPSQGSFQGGQWSAEELSRNGNSSHGKFSARSSLRVLM